MKDYKYFFYQYSEFHVFTRQSSVENCYQRTNYNIMVSSKNDVNPGGQPGPRHTLRTKHKKVPHEKVPDVRGIAKCLKRVPQT